MEIGPEKGASRPHRSSYSAPRSLPQPRLKGTRSASAPGGLLGLALQGSTDVCRHLSRQRAVKELFTLRGCDLFPKTHLTPENGLVGSRKALRFVLKSFQVPSSAAVRSRVARPLAPASPDWHRNSFRGQRLRNRSAPLSHQRVHAGLRAPSSTLHVEWFNCLT